MKKKLSLLLTTLLVATTLLVGCGSKKEEASADGMTDVTMAFCTFTGYAPMFIAQEQGYFEDAGIKMNIQVIDSGDRGRVYLCQPDYKR